MNKFEEEFNYLIELSGKVLTGQIEAEEFEKHREIFLKKYSEKQQPEIPEFVANHIEATKEDCWTMLSAMNASNLSSRLVDWLKGGNFRNQEIFAQAWLNGYTVAKEKLYKVVFPKSHSVLCKTGEVVSFAETVYEKYLLENAMTELEIKAIDERYWQFAVPVEEK